MSHLLVEKLQLTPHPEGGYYREIYRSPQRVQNPANSKTYSALTTIYYLLEKGQVSSFHKILSDEIWHFYQGSSLEIITYSEHSKELQHHILNEQNPVFVVSGGVWQASRPQGEYTLLGCTVAPGFEFSEFVMMNDSTLQETVLKLDPSLQELLPK